MVRSRNRILRAALAGALVLGAALVAPVVTAPAALAAKDTNGLELSRDGESWADTLGEPVFADLGMLVPGDTESTKFFVRNGSENDGYLRVSLTDVVSENPHYKEALSVTAAISGREGVPVPLSSADAACMVLIEGKLVSPGESVEISAKLALGVLLGNEGQNSDASFNIRVALSEIPPGTLDPTACDVTGSDIDAGTEPGAGADPGDEPSGTTGSGTAPAGTVNGGGTQDGDLPGEAPQTLPETPIAPTGPLGWFIDPNTGDLREEVMIYVFVAAFILGGGGFAFLAWRKRHRGDDDEALDEGLGV